MKVIVCGAGQVGFNIAQQLSGEGNDVVVIDQSPDLIQRLSDSFDVQAMVGHASHPDMLERAGAADADMIIAVTYSDEVNMIACQVAHSLFNVPTKVARVRAQSYLDPVWSELFQRNALPIDVVISPEVEVARAIMRRLQVPGAFDMIPFADDRVRVIGVRLGEDCPILNTPLRQLTELFPDLTVVVTGVIRNDRLFVPGGDDQLLQGDEIYFTADTTQVPRAMPLFGHEETEARRIVLIGAGNIGSFLARQIEAEQPNVNLKVIEASRARAEEVRGQLKRAIVLHGDALNQEVLDEANVPSAEAIVVLTNDDEVNILASLLAKREGCKKAITLVNNNTYRPLMTSLGIDVVVSPRATTVSTILQHVRRGRIRSLHSLRDGAAEVVEAEAMETSSLVGTPLRDIKLPKGMMVGAIVRGAKIVIPRGDTVVEPHDRVIMFALKEHVKKLEKMFSVRLEFF
ncbi:MAG: Trk system potassium transporter TrkA [Alphaproteobacteria bacterium]|nr:Trk system potassium transporter TrkA [Alphaproteobacteria bacterium]